MDVINEFIKEIKFIDWFNHNHLEKIISLTGLSYGVCDENFRLNG